MILLLGSRMGWQMTTRGVLSWQQWGGKVPREGTDSFCSVADYYRVFQRYGLFLC